MSLPPSSTPHHVDPSGFAARIVRYFIDSKLTPLVVIAAVALGAGAVVLLPREEEPQIVVPMIDLFVEMPGADAMEVEQRVAVPMEKLLWEIPGVEYIYSTSSPGAALVTVRFYVGQNEEEAIVQLNQKMYANFDRIPPGVSQPLVKPRRIDDVPILALTLHGNGYDSLELRRIAAQLVDAIQQVPEVSETRVIGGRRREVRVELDAARLAAHHVDPLEAAEALASANRKRLMGSFSSANQEIQVEAGRFLMDAADVAGVVVESVEGRPVYLRDVATIVDGAEEPVDYVLFGTGAGAQHAEETLQEGLTPAVTIAIAKRKGANAVWVADAVLRKVELLRGELIPADVPISITRNYGLTAKEKSNELLFHMAIAVVGVTILIAFALGWKESGVVAVAIPVTLALTLSVFYLLGFTLNRITLFALIFSIGILVDDPIVDVENIVRHFRLPQNAGRPLLEVTVEAVNEVRSPLILATLTVIAAILPMAFVSGLMGPYMRPIPIGSSAAMLFSMFVAFVVTPWAAYHILRGVRRRPARHGESEDRATRAYRRVMGPLIHHPRWQLLFLVSITLLLLASMALVALGGVKVKMLPFDNKSEFQIVIDMDEGTTLEQTARVAREIADAVRGEPEVTHYQIYVGTSGPYNFNGLVRHYFLRRGPNVADIQVNLLGKHERSQQSHEIAKRVRPAVQAIAARHGARVKIAEVPPGPPVLQTLVAEVYGPDYPSQIEAARRVRDIFESTEGVVDVDWSVEADQRKLVFEVDSEKAALNGISAQRIADVLRIAQQGLEVGLQHDPFEKEDVPIVLRVPSARRASANDLLALPVKGADGSIVPLGELVSTESRHSDVSIQRKNLMPVVYVTGDVAGAAESPVYAILKMNRALAGLDMQVLSTHPPFSTEALAMKWDGEWHITYEVFRDLGAAFAVVLILIYVLVVGWFRSFATPFIIMAAIPFSLVGILPAHWALGAFFTATSMIGFIAGAGIVVRNSIILVDFIELRLAEGMPLADAVVDAGAVRFRPMMLTAAAVVVGASVILFDPIFQGLAISLMAGEIASLFLSRMAVPVIYFIAARRREAARAPAG